MFKSIMEQIVFSMRSNVIFLHRINQSEIKSLLRRPNFMIKNTNWKRKIEIEVNTVNKNYEAQNKVQIPHFDSSKYTFVTRSIL